VYNNKEPKLSRQGVFYFFKIYQTMKVILLTDVPKIGRKGELKEVSDGFGTNMLIRKGLAALATKEAQDSVAKQQKIHTESKQRSIKKAQENKTELERRTFTVKVKVGEKGQIFGGVHEKDIASAIFQKTKIQLDKSQFDSHKGIKQIGEHTITIKLGQGVSAKTKINLEAL
jgi:large subunit ribosomal protein L9